MGDGEIPRNLVLECGTGPLTVLSMPNVCYGDGRANYPFNEIMCYPSQEQLTTGRHS